MATSSQHAQISGFVDNWQGERTLAECNLHMFNTEDSCDVTFRCGSLGHVMKAHRYVLISRSSVFHAMFTGPLAETSDVTIPEIEHRFFKEFILYLYTDSVTVESDNATVLLYAARKYAVTRLEAKCSEYLERNLTVENACVILEAAHRFDQGQLMEKAMVLLKGEGERSLQSLGFLALSHELVDQIVDSDDLVADEHVIFTAINNWSEAECGCQGRGVTPEAKRSVLGDTLMKVRFPLMKQVFLEKEVKVSGLLADHERMKILEYIASTDIDVRPFSTRKRHATLYTEGPIVSKSRFKDKGGIWGYGFNRPTSIAFKVNTNIMLCGYQAYGPCSTREATYEITTYWGDGSVLQPKTSYRTADEMFDVMFSNPIKLTKGNWYTFTVVINGPASLRGVNGVPQVVGDDGVEFYFKDSDQCKDGTNVTVGQIPSLIYRRW